MSLDLSIAQQLEILIGEFQSIRDEYKPSIVPWMAFHISHSVGTRPYTLEEDRRFRQAYYKALVVKSQHRPYSTEYEARIALLRRGCLYVADGYIQDECPTHFGLQSAQHAGVDLSFQFCYACRHHYLGLPVAPSLYSCMERLPSDRPVKKCRIVEDAQ